MKKQKTHKSSKKVIRKIQQNRPKRKSRRWIAPTMAAASGATGMPIEALKAAKLAGCDAFAANSNVDCDRLIKFFAANPKILEDVGVAINTQAEEAMTARVERLTAEHKLKVAEEKVLPLDHVKRDVTRGIMELKRKAFALPKRLAQIFALETDVITIEQRLNQELIDVFGDTAKNPWAKMNCPHCTKEISSDDYGSHY